MILLNVAFNTLQCVERYIQQLGAPAPGASW